MRTLWNALLDLVYPPTCAGCSDPCAGDPYFCARCAAGVAWRDPVRCPCCDHPTVHARSWCTWCREMWPRVERVVALGYYAGPLKRAIRIFKYGAYRRVGLALAGRLADRVPRELGGIDAVIAVPGGRKHIHRRGFDPPEVIAEPLARALAVPLEAGVIRRARDGTHDAARGRTERELEVAGRFACARPGALAGQRVLVVDDVYTTGATMEEVARLVREEAGARSTVGAVLARTVNDGVPR